MRAFPSFIQPSRNGHRAAATAVVVALVAGLAAGFSLFGATAPAAAATGPVSAGLTSVGPFTKTASTSGVAAAAIMPMAVATPQAPQPVWTENFSTGLTGSALQRLGTYASGAYTADAFWIDYAKCNGVIVTYNTDTFPGTDCSSSSTTNQDNARINVRRMADVLGQVDAGVAGASTAAGATSTPSTTTTRANRAVAEWTDSGTGVAGANKVVERLTSLGITGTGSRYLLPSIDIVEASCDTTTSRSAITLSLGYGSTSITGSPITACTDVRAAYYTSPLISGFSNWIFGGNAVRAGRFTSDTPLLVPAAQFANLRPIVRNTNNTSNGNDFAIDNLRLLDATPTLSMEFAPETAVATTPTTLTFTITNTTELAAKNGWSFVDTLPAGVTLANNTISSTCQNAAITPDADPRVIRIGGNIAAGVSSCTITVNVVAASAGTYTNAPTDVTLVGLNPPVSTTLTVDPVTTLSVSKVLSGSRLAAADQFELSIFQGSTAVGAAVTTTGSGSTVNGGIQNRTVTPGETYVISERVTNDANALNYSSSYTCTRVSDGTTIASGSSANGTLTIPNAAGASVDCVFTNAPQPNAALACSPYTFYSLATGGQIVEINIASGATRNIAAFSNTGSGVNAFAIAKDGTAAYAVQRPANQGATSILRYVAGSTPDTATSAMPTAGSLASTPIVAGAVNPASGTYYFGGFRDADTDTTNGSQFWLWSYTPGTNTTAFVGHIATPASAVVGNGDLAFDKDGNLYIIGAESEGSGSAVINVFVVRAATVNAASGSTTIPLASSVTTPDTVSGVTNVNGVAFSSRGTVYLSGNGVAREFDPMTWRATGTSSVTLTGVGDLASCTSPTTLTVQKNIVARAVTNNPQITLSVRNSDGDTVASATTTGAGTGIQAAAQVGPLPARIGSTVSVGEAAAGTGTNLAGYKPSVYECWADGRRISNGVLVDETANGRRSTDVTIPNQLGVATTCTIFNSPQDYATVTLRKAVSNSVGASPAAASGWVLRADAATAGFPTSAGALTATAQETTGTSGAFTSYYIFGAQASTSMVVSEVQQPGYQLQSLVCQVGSSTVTPATSTQTIDGQARIAATLSNVAPGSVVDCTFTNRPVATLTLVKNVAFGSAATNVWNLAATKADNGALNGPSGVSGSAGASAIVSSGAVYRLSETVTTGNAAIAAPYNNAASGTWSCVAGSTTVPVSAAGDITLTRGTNVTCTVTNTTATITLLKDMQAGFPSGTTPAAWNLTATPASGSGLSTFTVAGAASQSAANTFNARPGVAYTLSEALASTTSTMPWRQLRLERLSGSTWVTVTNNTITAPDAGTNAVYRYVNAPIVQPTLPLTGGLGSDAFLYAGAGIVALALALALWHQRRRFRDTAI